MQQYSNKHLLTELYNKHKSCNKCRLKHTRNKFVPGKGNANSKILIIAQAPGRTENENKQMLTGPSGKVIDHIFEKNQLSWNQYYFTNLIKCYLPGCRRPRKDEMDACFNLLREEINIIKPTIFVTLGYHVTKFILKKYNLYFPEHINFPYIFGNMFYAKNIQILPLRHPATVVHNTYTKSKLIDEYKQLITLGDHCPFYSNCPIVSNYYSGLVNISYIKIFCKGLYAKCIRYKNYIKDSTISDVILPDGKLDQQLKPSCTRVQARI